MGGRHIGQGAAAAMAGVEPALLAQQAESRGIQAKALALADQRTVPTKPEPAQISLDRLGGAASVAGCVEIIEPQQPLAAAQPALQPAEQGSAQISYVQNTGRRGGEPAATLALTQP